MSAEDSPPQLQSGMHCRQEDSSNMLLMELFHLTDTHITNKYFLGLISKVVFEVTCPVYMFFPI